MSEKDNSIEQNVNQLSQFELIKASFRLIEKTLNSMKENSNYIKQALTNVRDIYVETLAKFGWFLSRKLDLDTFLDITPVIVNQDISFDERKKIVDKSFMDCIDKKVRKDIFTDLFSYSISSQRAKLLSEIEFAFKHEKYYLASVALATFIEGIMAEKCIEVGLYDNGIHQINQKTTIKFLGDKTEDSIIINLSLLKVIELNFYESFKIIDGIPTPTSEIGRHSILHGINLEYGRELVFIKLLLILDGLFILFEDISFEQY